MASIQAGTSNGPTTDKLRHDIDHGRGGDKVSAGDPAAAPLGTDDEAAGRPPSGPSVSAALRQEATAEPESRSDKWPLPVMIAVAVAVAAAAVFALM